MASQPRVVRVFVSSTFRDMHADREELIKRVFPQLRKLCEQRGVTWAEVDLRWGVSNEQEAEGGILPVCLAEVGNCRPYFIGLLADRYGWRPDELPAELVESEPWLAGHRGRSVTELEVLHGVLNDPRLAPHAFFYFRDPAYLERLPARADRHDFEPEDHDAAERLRALKQRIRASGCPVREDYREPRALGELVLGDLQALVERLFPATTVPDPLERESAAHEAFAVARRRVYVGRQSHFDRLDAHADVDGPPLTVMGESGVGKSALLANWVLRRRAADRDALVLVHFLGATTASTDWASMLRRLIAELQRHFGIPGEVPDSVNALRAAFVRFLRQGAERGRVVLVLDGLNQLEDRDQAPDLAWLPRALPDGVRVVLSTLPGRALEEIERRGWPTFTVASLDAAERLRVIAEYLAQYRKALTPARTQRIAAAAACANPLYLRALLEELRVFGVQEQLDERITHYLAASDAASLFAKVLERFEQDFERDRPGLVGDAMALLWAARRGLSESELLDLLGAGTPLPHAVWSPLYLAVEPSLVSRSGLLDFFHDHVREAVSRRYLPDEPARRRAHRRLADYFEVRDASPRRVDELPWQLAHAEAWDRLAGLLGEPEFLSAAWWADAFEVQRLWAELEARSGFRMREVYGRVLRDPGPHLAWSWPLALLLGRAGHREEAGRLWGELAQYYYDTGDLPRHRSALGNGAGNWIDQGRLDDALRLLDELEPALVSSGDKVLLKATASNQGVVLMKQGRLDEALERFERQRGLAEELGDRHDLGVCLSNIAHVRIAQQRLEEASTLVDAYELLAHETGDPTGLAAAYTLRARLQRDPRDALPLLEQAETIARRYGELPAVILCLGNRAEILAKLGQLDAADALLDEAVSLARRVPDQRTLANVHEVRAVVLECQGRPREAAAAVGGAVGVYRETGELHRLAVALASEGKLLEEAGDAEAAVIRFAAAQDPLRALKDQRRLLHALDSEAHLLLALREWDRAAGAAAEAVEILRASGDQPGLAQALALQIGAAVGSGRFRFAEILVEERARIYGEIGDAAKLAANEDLRAVVRQDRRAAEAARTPDDQARALCGQAAVLQRKGQREEALALLRDAVTAAPGYVYGWSDLGACLLTLGRCTEAVTALGRAAALAPDDYQTSFLLAEAHARTGRIAEARGSLEICRQLDPDGSRTLKLATMIAALEKDAGASDTS